MTAFLGLSILAGLLWLTAGPKSEFSENENRMLQTFPELQFSALADGSYMKSVESCVCDQFPLRDQFVDLCTRVQLSIGKTELNPDYSTQPAKAGVYFGKNSHLYEPTLPDTKQIFEENADAFGSFAKQEKIPFFMLAVPSAAQEQLENLPAHAAPGDQLSDFRSLEQQIGSRGHVVDLFSLLSLKTAGDVYFKTDHHWNMQGAYIGYKALIQAMGKPIVPLSEYTVRTAQQPFYGTLFSKAVFGGQQPDIFSYPVWNGMDAVTVQIGSNQSHGIYKTEFLNRKDKYSVYFGGNPAVAVIRNPSAPGGKLLLMKDSFANSMIPYLCRNFSEIHMIDLRYFNQDLDQYISRNGIRQAAAVYSIQQLCDVSVASKLTE